MANKLAATSKRYLLIAGDVLILYVSLFITLLVRYQESFNAFRWSQHFVPFSVVFIMLLIVFYIDGLYDLSYDGIRRQLANRILRSGAIGGAAAAIFFYVGYERLFNIQPQTILVVQLGLSLLLIYAWHVIAYRLSQTKLQRNGLLLIGDEAINTDIATYIQTHPQYGYEIRGWMSASGQAPIQGIDAYQSYAELKQICIDKKITTIISSVHPRQNPELLKNLFNCLSLKINFFESATFYEKITGKIPVTTIEHIWFLENINESNKRAYDLTKRMTDVILGLILFVFTVWAWPLIAAAIKFTSPGSVFFTQQRVGKDRNNFTLVKFRTMVADAEADGAKWASANDPRVTKVGAILRASRLDELPQVINIIKGEMSLIGPRPERPEFVSSLQEEIPFYTERLLVKPGLTGWAQVEGPAYGGSVEESLEKLQYDLFYIKNRSLGIDFSIILKTIKTVLSRRGH